MIFLIAFLVFALIIIGVIGVLKRIKPTLSILEMIIGNIYIFSLMFLYIGLQIHNNQYYTAIDPIDQDCYIPFGEKHIITLIFYFIAFNVSIFLLWLKKYKLPPLARVLSLSFLVIGAIIWFIVLFQISQHNIESLGVYNVSEHYIFLVLTPIVSIIISIALIYQNIKYQINYTVKKKYSNKFLNQLNLFFAQKSNLPLWSFILMLPLLLIVTIVLILFGQDSDSLIKVFTDTATWRFSQKIHPPILEHNGHYLCTVAACGNPKVVKPIRLGKRNKQTIIVNRQLLIANAFEEMVQDFSPKTHYFIRSNYDKYGYNLSTKIKTSQMSNLTYLLMKPLEWLFLFCLYLFCEKPEEKINKQYQF